MKGITKKKIIIKACAVTKTFYSCPLPDKIWLPGAASSRRIRTESVVPTTAEKAPRIIYNVPISLWFVENSQRDDHD